MNEPLDELYFTWLYRQVGSLKYSDPGRTYWALFRQLHSTQFIWLIDNDDNRAADGMELRIQFLQDEPRAEPSQQWMEMECSVLEMLIALSRRVAFEADGDPRGWFWELIENLEIVISDDEYSEDARRRIDHVLHQLLYRTYHSDGRGGLFPLENPRQDQTWVEIWYQLNAYLIERL